MVNGNESPDEKVINFYRFIQTFISQAVEVVSVNIKVPGQRWVRRLNNSEVKD